MKHILHLKHSLALAALAIFMLLPGLGLGQFTQGNLAVLRVGDGVATLSAASTAIFIDEYNTSGTFVQSIAIPTTGINKLTNSGNSGTEGLITLSPDGQFLTLAGYDVGTGTVTVAQTASSTVNRKLLRVDNAMNYVPILSSTAYSGTSNNNANIRGGVTTGTDYWASGTAPSSTTAGVQYFGTGTPAQVSTTVTNLRAINIFNGQLYFSTGSGTVGIYAVGTGLPTITGIASTNVITTGTSSTASPYAFAFNSTTDICYIADDRTTAPIGGIQKWTKSGTVWSQSYVLSVGTGAGARGLTVNWSGANPVIFATTTGNKIVKITDTGSGSTSTDLATSATNTAFRGIAFAPFTPAASTPIISVTPATLTNFSYVFGSGPSAEKTFTVSGINLTGNITLVPPTDYEISTGTGGAFVATNPVTLTQSGGAVPTTTIYARLKAGLAVGAYINENIVSSSAGATDQNVNCSGLVTINYYSAATGNLDLTASWGTNADGTGSNPSDFTTAGQVFNIRNNATPTIGASWTVSGIGSKVILGDGTNDVDFIIPLSYAFTGTVDLSANSTITIQNSTIPTFGTINAASTVVYDGVAHSITQVNYGNLIISSDGATFAGNATVVSGNLILDNTTLNAPSALPFATIRLGGNLTYIGTVTPPVEGSSITLLTTGTGTQTITGNGNTARWFRLQTTSSGNNVVLSETGGSTNLYVGNTNGGGINLATGSLLTLNGNTLTFFNGNGTILGTGTITCNVSSNIIINKNGVSAFGTLLFTPGSETLNNITLNMIGAGNTVTLGSVLTVNGNLTITSGIFVVAEGSQLTVNGILTNLEGVTGLVVKSGGSLIESTVGVSATVERDVNAWTNALHGWHLLSSPVQNQAIAPAFTSSPATDYDFYQWGEVTNTWLNQKDAANNIINFVPGTGYLVAYAYADTKQFSGVLNDTNFLVHNLTLSTGTNAGWNLLGNPYPSALKWNDGSNWTVPATFGSIAKVWDEGDAGYDDIDPNDLIPAMNGFMVQVVSGSPASLIIPGAARIHDATDTWYKSSEGLLKLIAHDLDNSTAQESNIRMNDNATEGYDSQFDSHFLAGFAPKFYSTAGSEQLSTNSLPGIDNSRIIPMGFVKNAAGNFSIQLMENSLTGVSTIYLTDNKTGSITNMSTTPVYNFTSVAGDDANRFLLKFQETASITDPDVTKDFTVHAGNGVVTILQTGNLSGNVIVTDMAGRTVATASLIAGSPTSISLKGHPGVYVVSIVTATGVSNVKVIVS